MIFSVVIPVHNVGRLITDCLNSVLSAAAAAEGQVECICVDDGSTDESGAVLDDFAARSPAVKVIHQANAGVAAARNCGLRQASGDWLLFVDADDMVRDTLFVDLEQAISRFPAADLFSFGVLRFQENSQPEWSQVESAGWRDAEIATRLSNILGERSFWQFAYRRREHGQSRYQALQVGEDIVFGVEALVRSQGCMITDRQEYGYRLRTDSATHTKPTVPKLMDCIRFNEMAFRTLSDSQKSVGSVFSMVRGNEWIEGLPKEILRNWRGSDFRQLWNAWLDSMSVAAEVTCFSRWQRFVARWVSRTRSVWICRLLCLFPAWLARKGLLARDSNATA